MKRQKVKTQLFTIGFLIGVFVIMFICSFVYFAKIEPMFNEMQNKIEKLDCELNNSCVGEGLIIEIEFEKLNNSEKENINSTKKLINTNDKRILDVYGGDIYKMNDEISACLKYGNMPIKEPVFYKDDINISLDFCQTIVPIIFDYDIPSDDNLYPTHVACFIPRCVLKKQ